MPEPVIDLSRTFRLVVGGLVDADKTWRDYLPEADNWQKTAFLLTGPLIIAATVAAYLLGLLSSDVSIFGQFRPTIQSSVINLITGAIAAGVVAFIVSALAGVFGGKSSFALGLAATTLAFIPGYLGQAVAQLPWIGGLLGLGLFIYALVLLWKIIPIYLEVPDGKRVGHYILSLVTVIVVMVVISMTVGRFLYPSNAGARMSDVSSERPSIGGLFGGVARQGELMAAADADRYAAPSDGRLTKNQVREFIRVMERTTEMQAQQQQQLESIAEKVDNKEKPSISDFGQMMSGMNAVTGLQTAEIEVVKSAGGNWAEHQWVREALRTAWVQRDINDAVAYNYELFKEHEDELAGYIQ